MHITKQLSLLITTTIVLPFHMFAIDSAIATPVNKQANCLDGNIVDNSGTVREEYRVGTFVLSDGTGSSINVRERPTTDAPVRYAAPSRRGVSISRQVVGEDGYCWLEVEGEIWSGERVVGSFTGWVRGDLVRMET